MTTVSVATGTDVAAASGGPSEISQRLESLPASSYLWRLVILLSLGGCFEIYDLFLTGYIAPGLNRSGLLTTTTQAFFGCDDPKGALSSDGAMTYCVYGLMVSPDVTLKP